MKKAIVFVLIVAAALSLAGCGAGVPGDQVGSEDFQKNMHQSGTYHLSEIIETDRGFYFQLKGQFVYYMDKATGRVTPLCSRPDCDHNSEECGASLHVGSMWFRDGRLYYSNGDYVEENGGYVNHGYRIYSVAADGTDRQVVQDLEFTPGGDRAYAALPIMHRGEVYFAYNGALYSMPLGGDIRDAVRIWGDEITDDGTHTLNVNALSYELWADGDSVYFMVNLPQEDGTYRDTLFEYGTASKEVNQVWQVPGAGEVGRWETTGVSVSQWYILDGYIYFYLSGGDFWRTDLGTGEHEKLADTHEKTASGSALFSDSYICLINDRPEETGGVASYGTVGKHVGGDTVYVYGLDGGFIREISLKPLYDQIDGITKCALAFCSGDQVYIVVDAGTWSERVNGVSSKIQNRMLFRADIGTGEISDMLYNW